MKIILSRKGFDSAAGGYPSPHFIESGRLLSLPIPEDNGENIIDTGKTYSDLKFDNNLSYLDVMQKLGIRKFEERYVHFDPDISKSVLQNRGNGWKGLFGQVSSAQSHLHKQEVEIGDLYLFFGWFRDVIKTPDRYKYVSGTDRHIIWGYMQIGEIQNIKQDAQYEDWKINHPHYYYRSREQNTGYIANEKLNFAPDIDGCGLFNYDDKLVLTCPHQKSRSIWQLPACFHPNFDTKMSYHEKLLDKANNPVWELHDTHCILNSVGRGQEFVIKGNEEVVNWAKNLVLSNPL